MTDFFREVDEDVRRDRLIRLWTKHRYLLIGLAVLVVAGTGVWHVYVTHRDQAAEAAGARFEAAAELARDGKSTEAAAAYEALSKTAPKGYAALARLRAAGEIASADPQAAIKSLETLAEDSSLDPELRDFARLRAAMLRLDSDDPAEFERRYAALASDSFPYHHEIRELLGLAALKRGSFDTAGNWLDGIVSDLRAPAGVRMRAQALLGLVQSSLVRPEKTVPAASQTGSSPSGDQPAK